MRRIIASSSLVLALIASFAGHVSAGVVHDNEAPINTSDMSYYEHQDKYEGGPQSLPYGMGNAVAVLDHARDMNSVNLAIATLQQRGYVRRPQSDVAGTQRGASFACIAFEKSGSPITARQPLLMIATQSIEVLGVGYVPATQIYAAMIADSAGQLRVFSTPADSALEFVGELFGGSSVMTRKVNAYFGAPTGINKSDEDFVYRYSAYESPHGTWQYHNTTSPEMQGLMSQAYQNVAWNAVGGAVTGLTGFAAGPQMGIATTLLGGYTSGLVAWHVFWIEHPRRR